MVKMSRFVISVFALVLLTSEVRSGTSNFSNFRENLVPRSTGLFQPWTLNLDFPSGGKISPNSTRRISRAGNLTSARNPKLLPKFSIVAGLDIGGGLPLTLGTNFTPSARISQANSAPGNFKPYIAVTYDPYPSQSAVHQSIQALYNLVERLSQPIDNFVDDRKRRKDKIKKSANKQKKKQQKIKIDAEEIDDSEEKITRKVVKTKKGTKNGARKNTNAKQAAAMNTTDTSTSMESGEVLNGTFTNTTDFGNSTERPGFYYGGNPQNIDNVAFTYDGPQGIYGAPSDNYGQPSHNYGPPSTNYGTPYAYGPPSYNYGPPSRGYGAPYETAHYTAFHDPSLIYDDPGESSFGPQPTQRWQQRLPFARSRNVGTTTAAPVVANGGGFVPIL